METIYWLLLLIPILIFIVFVRKRKKGTTHTTGVIQTTEANNTNAIISPQQDSEMIMSNDISQKENTPVTLSQDEIDDFVNQEIYRETVGGGLFDISESDDLFRDAAELTVNEQIGSASVLQQKLKIGYNRAGRIMDQLEFYGIIGPFDGTKARKVLIKDINSLNILMASFS